MAYNENIAARVRQALSPIPGVKEKKMFGSLAFMVNSKLCITAGPGRIMCRIDPLLHDDVTRRKGCRAVVMKGKALEGYVHVDAASIEREEDLRYWVELALDYNKHAKQPARKRP
jgi:TfoX/Sxy family transcriptional regulator of competence genes